MGAQDEDAIVRALGPFGAWQARGFLLLALVKVPAAWHMLSILFTAPQPSAVGGRFWCSRPKNENGQMSVEQWLEISHPRMAAVEGKWSYDSCHIFGNSTASINGSGLQSAPPSINPCPNFEFQQSSATMVTQWELVCDREVLVNVSQLSYLLGILFGGVLTFMLLKKFSPKTVVLLGAAFQIAAGVGTAYVYSYELHLLLRTATALGCCAMFSAGFQICWDITAGWQRTLIGVSYEHFWSLGIISLGWLSDLSGSWNNLQVVISAPTVLVFLVAWWIPDSPRWLLAAGQREKAETLLRSAAAANGRPLPQDFHLQGPNNSTSLQGSVPAKSKLKWGHITALLVLWITTVVNYYGALLNIRNVGGPRLPIRTTLAGVAEIIGASLGAVLLIRLRYKWAWLGAGMIVGGTACVASWALPVNAEGSSGGWPMVGMALVGRIVIACSLAVLQNGGSAELIPVLRRPTTILTMVTLARLVLQGAPFMNSLAQYGESVSLSIYGCLTILGGVAAISLAISEFRKNRCNKMIAKLMRNGNGYCGNGSSKAWTLERNGTNGSIMTCAPPDKIFGLGMHFNPCFVED